MGDHTWRDETLARVDDDFHHKLRVEVILLSEKSEDWAVVGLHAYEEVESQEPGIHIRRVGEEYLPLVGAGVKGIKKEGVPRQEKG